MTTGSQIITAPYLRVLGPAAIIGTDGEMTPLSSTQRRLLARLALAAPNTVEIADVIPAVWENEAPRTARQAIQNQVSRIRAMAGDGAVITTDDSYLLGMEVDSGTFLSAAVEAEHLLDAGSVDAAFETANAALGLWAGDPFVDILHVRAAAPVIDALASTHRSLRNTRLEAAIAAEQKNWALHEARILAGESPFDERRAALLARALLLHGRRVDALTVITEVRHRLRTELGIEEGGELATVEFQILHPGAPAPERLPPSGGVFAGRRRSIRFLLAEVARRNPVLVHGEPGIGVSRFLSEARTHLYRLGLQVILLRAEEYPHSAISLIEEVLDELGVPTVPGMSVFNTFQSYLDTLSTDDPLVLIVDDAQFLGPSVTRVLDSASRLPSIRLILGAHTADLGFDGSTPLHLEGLSSRAIAQVARARGVPDGHELLVEHSGGNPAVLGVLLDSITAGVPILQMPPSSEKLTELAERLIEPLHSQARKDVLLAAVAGTGYPRRAFDHIPWPWEPRFPPDLVHWGKDDTLRFRHEALRTALYSRIPRGQLLEMHHALGTAAETAGAPAATVARHLLQASEIDPTAGIRAARAAARAAAQVGAHIDSAWWLSRAREIDPGIDSGLSLELRIEYADALRLSGDPLHLVTSLDAVRDALAIADESLIARAAFVLLQLGGSSPAGELDPQIKSYARRAISAITDPNLRALVQASASLAFSMTGNAVECRDLFLTAEANATDPRTRGQVLPFAYLALGLPGDLADRSRHATDLIGLGQQFNDPVMEFEGLHLRFSTCLQRGEGLEARSTLERMQEIIESIGDVGRRWSVMYCMATLAEIDGDLEACERLAGKAHAIFTPVSPDRALAAHYAQLLPVRQAQGRLQELLDTTRALVTAQPGVPAWHAAHALVLSSSTDAPAATDEDVVEHAQIALDLAQEDFTWLGSHVIGGSAAAVSGDQELMNAYRERLEPWADLVCWQGTCSYGPVAVTLAALAHANGDHAVAKRYEGIAADLHSSLREGGS